MELLKEMVHKKVDRSAGRPRTSTTLPSSRAQCEGLLSRSPLSSRTGTSPAATGTERRAPGPRTSSSSSLNSKSRPTTSFLAAPGQAGGNSTKDRCRFCGMSNHPTQFCRAGNGEERFQRAKSASICLCCLQRRSLLGQVPVRSPASSVEQSNHHAAICSQGPSTQNRLLPLQNPSQKQPPQQRFFPSTKSAVQPTAVAPVVVPFMAKQGASGQENLPNSFMLLAETPVRKRPRGIQKESRNGS